MRSTRRPPLEREQGVGLARAAAREDLVAAVAVDVEHGGARQVVRGLVVPAVREVDGEPPRSAATRDAGGHGAQRLGRVDPGAARGGEAREQRGARSEVLADHGVLRGAASLRRASGGGGGCRGWGWRYWRTKVTVPTGTRLPSFTK